MSTPISPSQSIDDLINKARMELLGDTVPLPKGTGSSSVPSFGNVQSGSSTASSTPPVEQDVIPGWAKSLMGGASPLEAGAVMASEAVIAQQDAPEPTLITIPGIEYLGIGGVGLASKAGQAGVIRKTLGTRMKGKKLAEVLPEIQTEVAAMGDEIYEVGANLWKANLKGMNPGKFSRFLSTIPEGKLPTFRAGMLEGLVENISNMPRLTQAAQQNLKSPAGRAMLRETLSEMSEEQFTKFMSLVDRGQYQRWRDMAIMVSSVYPVWRFIGNPIVEFFTGK